LNKGKLGDFLGEEGEEQNSLLLEFCYSFHFQGQSLESALRIFCSKLKIPLDSNKLDRIMEAFATSYFSMNKGTFSSADTIHKISFSCIMLNMEYHHQTPPSSSSSPSSPPGTTVVKKKSLEAFIANHRGIDGGADLPRTLLESLFSSITTTEITTPLEERSDVTVLFTNPDKQGWLRKQGGRHKGWAKRYFVLSDATLFYFENEGDVDPKGFFPLDNVKAFTGPSNKKQITLLPKTGEVMKSAKFDNNGEMLVGNHKTLILTAASEVEAAQWEDKLLHACR
jgi:cytohesin